jgi:hypothetical protein
LYTAGSNLAKRKLLGFTKANLQDIIFRYDK